MAKKNYPQKPVPTGAGIELRPNPVREGTVYPVRIVDGAPKGPTIPPAPDPVKPLADEVKAWLKLVEFALFVRQPEINVVPVETNPPPASPTYPAGYDGIHPTALDGHEQVRSWLAFASVIAYSSNSSHSATWKTLTGGQDVRFFPCQTTTPHAPGGFIVVYPDYILVAIQGTTTRAQILRYVTMQQSVKVGMTLGLDPENTNPQGFNVYEPFQDQSQLWLQRLQVVAEEYPGRNLLLTGHSLGGAICHIINYWCALKRAVTPVNDTWTNVRSCVTFGSPRAIGEHPNFDLGFPQTFSIEAEGDPIPFMPYHGQMKFRFLNEGPGPEIRRLRVMGARGPDLSHPNCAPEDYKAPDPRDYWSPEDLYRSAGEHHSMSRYASRAFQLADTFGELKDQWQAMKQVADKSLIVDINV